MPLDSTTRVAVIGALGVVLAAILTAFGPDFILKLKARDISPFAARILSPDGRGIEGAAVVAAYDDHGEVLTRYTDAQGKVTFPLTESTHSLKLTIEAPGFPTTSRDVKAADQQTEIRLGAVKPSDPERTVKKDSPIPPISTKGNCASVTIGNDNQIDCKQ